MTERQSPSHETSEIRCDHPARARRASSTHQFPFTAKPNHLVANVIREINNCHSTRSPTTNARTIYNTTFQAVCRKTTDTIYHGERSLNTVTSQNDPSNFELNTIIQMQSWKTPTAILDTNNPTETSIESPGVSRTSHNYQRESMEQHSIQFKLHSQSQRIPRDESTFPFREIRAGNSWNLRSRPREAPGTLNGRIR